MPFVNLPEWGAYLIEGILTFIGIASGAVVLTRAGRNPYWVFLALIPVVNIIAVWYFAFSIWPKRLK